MENRYEHNMDIVTGIEEKSCCHERHLQLEDTHAAHLQDEVDPSINDKLDTKIETGEPQFLEITLKSEPGDMYLQEKNFQVECETSTSNKLNATTEMKYNFQEVILNEPKFESEVPQVLHMDLESEGNVVKECKNDPDLYIHGRVGMKVEVKEELMWENKAMTDVKYCTDLAPDALTQDDIKDTVSDITGMDKDFPLIQPPRLPPDASCSNDSGSSGSVLENKLALQKKALNIDCKKAAMCKVNEVSLSENSCALESVVGSNTITESRTPAICNKLTETELLKKSNLCHSGPTPYICEFCNTRFAFMFELKQHILTHSPYKCDICDKSFKVKSVLNRHKLIHSGEKQYRCYICEKRFNDKFALTAHKATHSGTKLYKCDKCEKRFNYKIVLNRHKLTHLDTKPYKCDTCEKRFNWKSVLSRHKLIHSDAKPYTCNICERSFNVKSALTAHKMTHSVTKPYQCDECEKSFNRKLNLNKHKLMHSGTKPHKCDVCDKSFSYRLSLRRHILLHSGTRPYKCDLCDKSFTQHAHLSKHKMIHSGSKPYKCKVCDKGFTEMSVLRKHAVIHSGVRAYKCDICGRSFSWASSLKRHTLMHAEKKE